MKLIHSNKGLKYFFVWFISTRAEGRFLTADTFAFVALNACCGDRPYVCGFRRTVSNRAGWLPGGERFIDIWTVAYGSGCCTASTRPN